MTKKESPDERKERFKAMSTDERKSLIRSKMKTQGLVEGSGVPGTNLSSYDRDEIWELIQVTASLSEMQTKRRTILLKSPIKKKSLVSWILLVIVFTSGLFLFTKQYSSPQIRRLLSVESIFFD